MQVGGASGKTADIMCNESSSASGSQGAQSPLEVVWDERFCSLWRDVNQCVVTREELDERDLPDNCTADDVWRALEALRRAAGYTLSRPRAGRAATWVNLPLNAQRHARVILDHSSANSVIGMRLANAADLTSVYLEGRVTELVGTLGRDGLATDYERVRDITMHEKQPRNAADAVVRAFDETLKAERPRGERKTAALGARDLYDALACALDRPSQATMGQKARLFFETVDDCLAAVPQVRGLDMLSNAARLWAFVGTSTCLSDLNATYASLVCKAYFVRCGFAGLSLLPIVSAGRSALGRLASLPPTSDMTGATVALLNVISPELEKLENTIRSEEERLIDLHERLATSGQLNYRQRATLEAFLDNTEATYDYQGYCEKFQVTYNTARTDLNGLAARGLLYTLEDNCRLAFYPVPGFVSRLERMLYME